LAQYGEWYLLEKLSNAWKRDDFESSDLNPPLTPAEASIQNPWMEALFVAHRIFYVAQVGPPAFPRFAIYDAVGHAWDGSSWNGRPVLYADQASVSNDCYDLQRSEAAGMKLRQEVEVPLRFEAFSDQRLDLEGLRAWLCRNVGVTIDVSTGSGPTPDSIVIGSLDWPRFARVGETT